MDRQDTEVIVEVGGLGYRVTVTPTLAGALDGDAMVWVHHHIREDAQTLYGFASRDERDVFEQLVATHGVGPALAMAILGVHPPASLRLAVATNDVGALCLVPGVGRKTATRLVLELGSRLGDASVDLTAGAVATDVERSSGASPHADVRDALVGLGYGADEIGPIVRELPVEGDAAALLKLALQKLARA